MRVAPKPITPKSATYLHSKEPMEANRINLCFNGTGNELEENWLYFLSSL